MITIESVELRLSRDIDTLDARLMSGALTQAEYDAEVGRVYAAYDRDVDFAELCERSRASLDVLGRCPRRDL